MISWENERLSNVEWKQSLVAAQVKFITNIKQTKYEKQRNLNYKTFLSFQQLKVRMRPKPWSKRWERPKFKIQGIRFDRSLTPEQMEHAQKWAKPWLEYDMLKEYDTSKLEEQILSEVQQEMSKWSTFTIYSFSRLGKDWNMEVCRDVEHSAAHQFKLILMVYCSHTGVYKEEPIWKLVIYLEESCRLLFVSSVCCTSRVVNVTVLSYDIYNSIHYIVSTINAIKPYKLLIFILFSTLKVYAPVWFSSQVHVCPCCGVMECWH